MTDSREDISVQLQQQHHAQTHIDKLTKELDTLKEANKELAEKFQVSSTTFYSVRNLNVHADGELRTKCHQTQAQSGNQEVEKHHHCLQWQW